MADCRLIVDSVRMGHRLWCARVFEIGIVWFGSGHLFCVFNNLLALLFTKNVGNVVARTSVFEVPGPRRVVRKAADLL